MQLERGGYLAVGTLTMLAMTSAAYIAPSMDILTVLAFVPLGIWLVIEAPFVPILAFMLLTSTRLLEAIPAMRNMQLAMVTGGFAVAAAVWHVGLRRTRPPYLPPELKWFCLLTLCVVVGLLTSYDRARTLTALVDSWSRLFVGFAVMIWLTRSGQEVMAACVGLITCGAVVSIIAIHNAVNGIGLVGGERITLTGVIGDPNDLALMLLGPLGLATAFLWKGVGFATRVLCAVVVLLVLIVNTYTMSRGGLLGVVMVFLVIGYLTGRLKTVAVMSVLASPLLLFMIAKMALRGDIADSTGDIDASADDRLNTWKAAIRMGLSRPLGVGYTNFAESLHEYADRWENFRALAAHSTWFEALGELGVVGLIAIVGLIAAAFRSLAISRRILAQADAPVELQTIALGLTGSLAGFCVSASFLSQLSSWMLYVLVALSVVLRHHVEARYAKTVPGSDPAPAGARLIHASSRAKVPT